MSKSTNKYDVQCMRVRGRAQIAVASIAAGALIVRVALQLFMALAW